MRAHLQSDRQVAVAENLDRLAGPHRAGADELVVVHHAQDVASRLRSVELLAEAADASTTAASAP